MTGNAIKQRELSSEELDAVSGGSVISVLGGFMASLMNALQQQQQGGAEGAQSGGPATFQQILQQMT
jgi:hypothetical protein